MNSLLRLGLLTGICAVVVIARADEPQKLFSDGFELLKVGKAKEAAAKFQAGLKADPKNALAHYYLGEAYLGLKRNADAEREFNKSLELDPNSGVAPNAKARHAELTDASKLAPKSEANAGTANGPTVQQTVEFLNELWMSEAQRPARYVDPVDLKTVHAVYRQSLGISDDGKNLVFNWIERTDLVKDGWCGSECGIWKLTAASVKSVVTISDISRWFANADQDHRKFSVIAGCVNDLRPCISVHTKSKKLQRSTSPQGDTGASLDQMSEFAELNPEILFADLRDIQLVEENKKYLSLDFADMGHAERAAKALTHLIEISGAKPAAAPLF